jgi:hypothetical protein
MIILLKLKSFKLVWGMSLLPRSNRHSGENFPLPRQYNHSAEKCLRTYIVAMVMFTLLYISVDGIKSLSLYDSSSSSSSRCHRPKLVFI